LGTNDSIFEPKLESWDAIFKEWFFDENKNFEITDIK